MATFFVDELIGFFGTTGRVPKSYAKHSILAHVATTATQFIDVADVLIIGRIPMNTAPVPGGARILVSATLGASATFALGTYTKSGEGPSATFTAVTAAKFRAAATITANVTSGIADTIALSAGVEETAEVWLGMVCAVAQIATGVAITFWFPLTGN